MSALLGPSQHLDIVLRRRSLLNLAVDSAPRPLAGKELLEGLQHRAADEEVPRKVDHDEERGDCLGAHSPEGRHVAASFGDAVDGVLDESDGHTCQEDAENVAANMHDDDANEGKSQAQFCMLL